MSFITIDGKQIGSQFSPYVIAELSANHNGSLQTALDTITAAKKCGASAIKLQTYTADSMTIASSSPDFMINGGLWDGYNLYELYQEAQTPFSWHREMFEHAKKIGITCFSTPFDEKSVDLLEDLNAPAYKVASFEATDLPLIEYIASTQKPMIMSTGMANIEEIQEMVDTVRSAGCTELILLHCISSYPAPIEQSNLLTIPDLQQRFGVQVGLSDHTLSNTASIVATTLGATVIEKHFILDRSVEGPDSMFSIEPNELSLLCQSVKEAWLSLGQAGYELKASEIQNIKFRRSVYVVKDLMKGDIIKPEHIRRIRPGYGLAPKYEKQILGRVVNQNVTRGSAMKWSYLT